jgi:hypothetical protein
LPTIGKCETGLFATCLKKARTNQAYLAFALKRQAPINPISRLPEKGKH